jgi:hypothetical protein
LVEKSCNYPNSLTDKEKAIISDDLSSVAPQTGLEPDFNPLIVPEMFYCENILVEEQQTSMKSNKTDSFSH